MPVPKTRFALVSRQRSGTKFLKLTLSKHPEVFTHPEVLSVSRDKWQRPDNVHHFLMQRFAGDPANIMDVRMKQNYEAYIEHLYETPAEPVVGLDLKYNQLEQFQTFKSCLTTANVHVIHLVRKNVLRQYLSELQYKLLDRSKIDEKNIYEIGALPITPVHLECDETLVKTLRTSLNQIKAYQTYLSQNFSYLEVHYESFIAKGEFVAREFPSSIAHQLYSFLGTDNTDFVPEVSRKAQHPFPINALISNFEAVRDFLSAENLGYLTEDDYGKS